MVSWGELADAEPDLAALGAEGLLNGPAYLGTVDERGVPRVHPVTAIFGEGRLFVFMEPTSPKGRDLRSRPAFALHNGVPDHDGTGGEVIVRGRATPIDDGPTRAIAAAAARYEPAGHYVLFELGIDEVVLTSYQDGLPSRRRWRSTAGDSDR
jgi:hypothetical protein